VVNKAWEELMATAELANREMVRGNAQPLKELYSHSEDVTVLGGFGGFERGWIEVEPRLDWAASQFADGDFSQQVVSSIVESDLAMIVTIERYEARVAKEQAKTHDELRVTQVFRRENGQWRLVHRHGDPLVQKRPPN